MADKRTDFNAILAQCQRDAVEWAAALVKIRSENPPGNEYDAAAFCAEKLREMGCGKVILDNFLPGRANVIAYAGDKDDLGLIFNGHLDVVTANGDWQYPPFLAVIKDGKLHGRGSADMKSGCAAMMAAVKALTAAGALTKKGVCITLVSDEEAVNLGIKNMLSRYTLRADACVIGEPTNLEVHYGNRGYASFVIRTKGTACHASEPENGVNAIYKMARVILKLEEFSKILKEKVNPQLGGMCLSVGVIKGGTSVNMVPANCEIVVEARLHPGMTTAALGDGLRKLLKEDAEVEARSSLMASLAPTDCELVRTAAASVKKIRGEEAVVTKFPACSEAAFFSVDCDTPTILLGPGDIRLAHKVDEYAPIREIEDAVAIYVDIAKHYTSSK